MTTRTGLSVANASQHLQQLRRASLVAARRQGKFVLYSLAADGMLDLLAALRHVAERRLAEVEHTGRGTVMHADGLEHWFNICMSVPAPTEQ